MTENIQKLRKDNLKRLIEKHGSQSAFGKAIKTSSTYISHILNGRRNLGPVLCRKIEKSLGIANDWMDSKH